MKIILSRKGFDSSSGLKKPSPILPPDESLLSLPIPREYDSKYSYDDLIYKDRTLASIIRELNGRLPDIEIPHVDPDLDKERLNRLPGWRPIFGQHGGDQTYLKEKFGIGIGDLFLFFGWFRRTELVRGKLQYVPGSKNNIHIIFGWLQVGKVIHLDQEIEEELPGWALYHPHVVNKENYDSPNAIYIASDNLVLSNNKLQISGGGVFPRFHSKLQLTWPGLSVSKWRLPRWFFPWPEGKEPRPPLSKHDKKPLRWQLKDDSVLLESVHLGQEFVLDSVYYPEAIPWLKDIFEEVGC